MLVASTNGGRNRGAFTLVEIVLALGLFVFAIVGLVFLLGGALETSRQTQRDSALASALTTASAVLRAADNTAVPGAIYFNQDGSLVPHRTDLNGAIVLGADGLPAPQDPTKVYFRFTTTLATTGTSVLNLETYVIKVTAPYPTKIPVGNFLASRMKK